MLKKGDWQERGPVTDQCHDRPEKPGKRSDKKLGQKSSKRQSSNARQLGCVFQDMTPPKSILRKCTDMPMPIQRVKFTKAIARHARIRDQNPSLGYICPGEPHERSSNAPKFEDRSQEETEWQEQGAREAAWKLVKSVLKLKEHERAIFFSLSENWCLPAPLTFKPDDVPKNRKIRRRRQQKIARRFIWGHQLQLSKRMPCCAAQQDARAHLAGAVGFLVICSGLFVPLRGNFFRSKCLRGRCGRTHWHYMCVPEILQIRAAAHEWNCSSRYGCNLFFFRMRRELRGEAMERRVQGHRVLSQAFKLIGLDAEVRKMLRKAFHYVCDIARGAVWSEAFGFTYRRVCPCRCPVRRRVTLVELVFLCWFSADFFERGVLTARCRILLCFSVTFIRSFSKILGTKVFKVPWQDRILQRSSERRVDVFALLGPHVA